jgi:hypothetical protein
MMMHTTPKRMHHFGISSSLTLFSLFFFFFKERTTEREKKEKSYDPVYVACLIKKRKEGTGHA